MINEMEKMKKTVQYSDLGMLKGTSQIFPTFKFTIMEILRRFPLSLTLPFNLFKRLTKLI